MPVKSDVQKASCYAAEQIEEKVGDVPVEVLDVVAKDPEEQHVPKQVRDPTMQKHAGQNGQNRRFKMPVATERGRDSRRHRRICEDKSLEYPRRKRDLINKHADVHEDQRRIHKRIGAARIEIL